MAAITLRLNTGTTTHPTGEPLFNSFRFINQGTPTDVKGSSSSIATAASLTSVDLLAMKTQIDASFTLAGTSAVSLGLDVAQTLAATGSTDVAALVLAANNQVTAVSSDIVLSFDTTAVTKKTQVRRALDAFWHQILGGAGGLAD